MIKKKWRSSWLIVSPGKHSWYSIDSIFWKTNVCQPNQSSLQLMSSWLKNVLYEPTEEDREFLESKNGWLNDNLIDAEQQLIFKALRSLEIYQSVLNCQNKKSTYFPVFGDHIQLLYDGSCHWLLTFTSSGTHCVRSVQIRSYFWSVRNPNTRKYGPEITPYLDNFHALKVKVCDRLRTNVTSIWKKNV